MRSGVIAEEISEKPRQMEVRAAKLEETNKKLVTHARGVPSILVLYSIFSMAVSMSKQSSSATPSLAGL